MTAFVVIAGVLVLGSLGLVLAPMLRGAGRGERRASHDMQIYRDQLRDIEVDRVQGRLSAEEAEGTRIEVARRLLAAAPAVAGEAAAAAAPPRVSRTVAVVLVLVVALAAAGLYGRLGAPGFPDQPLALRLAGGGIERMARPSQAEAEAMVAAEGVALPEPDPQNAALIAQLRAVREGRPDVGAGLALLARSLAWVGRLADARVAQGRVVELMGAGAGAEELTDHAELMIYAARGYVSPEAEAVLVAALARDPDAPRARYYSGLAALQAGRADIAHGLWSRLLDEGPADAPWMPGIEAGIDEVARLAGLPPRAAPRGPTRADVEAAEGASAAEREAMAEGMVARLAGRLAEEGGPPQDGAQLVRSLGVLGRAAEARAIRDEARQVFAGDAGALALIDDAAAGLGP
jgi:cytochrome c-type biogenesis protein CcmH